MTQERALDERKKARQVEPAQAAEKRHAGGTEGPTSGVIHLQQQVGNRAVQRLIAQRSGDGAFELDEATAGRINQARGGGQALDGVVQEQMGEHMGHDFSGVRVHTGAESDALNHDLSAKAFTTGRDIFFREGAYDPGSGSGRELIAHELSHVVQQSTGRVGGSGGGMTVRPAGDIYEQEADAVARTASTSVPVQRQAMEEEEEVQAKALQRQGMEEEEELQTKALQRQEVPEEKELQTKALQRQEMPEEEELQTKALQRQEMPEEEELQTKALQRQEEMPEEEV